MTHSPLDDITNVVKDAAYVTVGLGVIAFQRLQVRRHELSQALAGGGDAATGALDLVNTVVGERVKAVEERFIAVLGR